MALAFLLAQNDRTYHPKSGTSNLGIPNSLFNASTVASISHIADMGSLERASVGTFVDDGTGVAWSVGVGAAVDVKVGVAMDWNVAEKAHRNPAQTLVPEGS